jgi:hypothetical protein
MIKTTTGKLVVALAAITLSGTSFIALADNAEQKNGKEQANAAENNNQVVQKGDQAPAVRFGKPTRDIGTDADQQSYDQTDGGIAGITIAGSRVFGTRVVNGATRQPASGTPQLTKHSGNPMQTTHLYAIYWGSTFVSGYQSAVNAYLSAITTASLNTVTNQYFVSPAKNQMIYSGTYSDISSTPPTAAPTTASILSEVYRAVVTLGKGSLDPNGLYMVFTNNYPSRVNYCAWHGAGSVNRSANFTVAYQPFLGGIAGCNPSGLSGFQSYSTLPGMDAVANVASHEIYETITDPFLNAWYDSNGSEIGDKCAWYSGYTKLNGSYSLQTEWSNVAKACAVS